jgi:hypothetical protein
MIQENNLDFGGDGSVINILAYPCDNLVSFAYLNAVSCPSKSSA